MGWVVNATPEVEAQSEYPTIIAICTVLSVLSITIVGLRLWIRNKARGLAADDWMAALSMVFALIYSILCIVQTRYGLGLPLALRPKENLIVYTRVNYAGRPIYQLGISFFKIALLISYLRLLQGTDQRTYRRVVWGTIALVFAGHLGCAFSLIFACTPVDKSWNPLKEGYCLPAGPSFTAYAVVTIVSDLIVAFLPIPVLIKLNVRMEKKLGLIFIFLLGLFTTLCSIMRYLQINRIQFGDGNSTMLILWGTIEFNVGNMVSSLPFLAPVFIRHAKSYASKANGSGCGSSGGRSHAKLGKNGGDSYKLSSVNSTTGGGEKTKASVTGGLAALHSSRERTGSEEHILAVDDKVPENSIVKSVTYSVRVDEETGKPGRR